MKKINKALMGVITLMGGIAPLYAGETEPSELNPKKSPSKSACGLKTRLDFIVNQDCRGENANKAGNKTSGGDGLVINPVLGRATLEKIIATGGGGNKGGHGVAAYGGVKTLIMDGSTITGGPVKNDKNSFHEETLKGDDFVGGAGVFCRAYSIQDVNININNSTITGGSLAPGTLASERGDILMIAQTGSGMNVIGTSFITLNNSAIASGNNGRGADGINMGSGTITIVESLVNSNGAAGVNVTGPAIINVDNNSRIDGGKHDGIGIKAHHDCSVELSGTVRGGRYAVLFNGDNNVLTLRHGVNLQGKLAAAGMNNQLNLKSMNQDKNSFDLGNIGLVNNQQGFTELHKTGEGNWTLQNNNITVGGLENVAVKQGSLTVAKTAILSAGEIYNAPGAFLGGSGTIAGKVKNAGTLYMGDIQKNCPFSDLYS